jgi:hypothetical protein
VDNLSRAPVVAFGPSRGLALACLGGGAILALVAIFGVDSGGGLLLGLAALLLLALGGYDTFLTPRLVASAQGLRIRTAGVRVDLEWDRIASVRYDERARLGLSSRTLEIDDGESLVVLGRHSLGREPRDAYDLIRAVRGQGQPKTEVR